MLPVSQSQVATIIAIILVWEAQLVLLRPRIHVFEPPAAGGDFCTLQQRRTIRRFKKHPHGWAETGSRPPAPGIMAIANLRKGAVSGAIVTFTNRSPRTPPVHAAADGLVVLPHAVGVRGEDDPNSLTDGAIRVGERAAFGVPWVTTVANVQRDSSKPMGPRGVLRR